MNTTELKVGDHYAWRDFSVEVVNIKPSRNEYDH